jgi:uncharacterized protein (UPF0548 family)
MFLLREPGTADVRDFLNPRTVAGYNYGEPGATADRLRLPGYNIDRRRIELGQGAELFERARKALRDWRQFSMEWVHLCWPFKKIQAGVNVVVLAHCYWLWSMNVSRIIYVIDEPRRFGFAYGTVGDHIMRGEERFLLEWRHDDTVWYEISAFSRPRHWLLWAVYPLTRRTQARFSKDSCWAMLHALASPPRVLQQRMAQEQQ